MRNQIVFSIFAMALVSLFFVQAAHAEFEDVPRDHWAYEAVSYLEDSGFVIGYPDGTFQGGRLLTRYEFAMVVSRLYDDYLGRIDDLENQPSVDQEAVLNMLIEEFQPDIDRLRDLIEVNAERIGVVEGAVDTLNTTVADINERIDSMPGNTFNTYGDIRVRFEGIYPDSGQQTQRPRYRLRWGFNQPVTDGLTFSARLASGSLGGITSTNETIDDFFGIDAINIDRAYLQYAPPTLQGWTFWAGKFAPPWRNTPLVWDSDTNVEGIAQQYTSGDLQFSLGELVPTTKGFYLVAQAGANNLGIDGLSAYATYHWINDDAWSLLSGNMQIKDSKDPNFLKSNWIFNRIDTSEYQAIEGYLQWKGNVGDIPMTVTADYLHNLASTSDSAEEDNLNGLTEAAWLEVAINNAPANIGDWQARAEYGRAQANSVLTWLADADRGGSDTEWWGANWTYRLMRNTDLSLTYIDRSRLLKDSHDQIIHVDLSTKF
jgi:hypothetical protein